MNLPVVGYMELSYDSMELIAAPGLALTACTAEPATSSADNLALLASWAAAGATSAALLDQSGAQPGAAGSISTD